MPRRARATLSDWNEPPVHDEDKLYDTIEVLVEIADGRGVSRAQVALAWLLRRPGVTSVVIGARTDEQLADNLARRRADVRDDEARLEQVSRAAAALPLLAPAANASDRLSAADLSLLAPYLD